MKKYILLIMLLLGSNVQNTIGVTREGATAFNDLTMRVGPTRNLFLFGGKQIWYLNALGAKIIEHVADIADHSFGMLTGAQHRDIQQYADSLMATIPEDELDPAYEFAVYTFNNAIMQKKDFFEALNNLNKNYEKITNALKTLKARPKRLPKKITLRSLKRIARGKTDFSGEY